MPEPKAYLPVAATALAALALGWAAGRYTAPTRVEERERIVERKAVDEDAVKVAVAQAKSTWERDVKTVTKIVYRDGQPVEATICRDSHVDSSSSSSTATASATATRATSETETDRTRVVEAPRPGWAVEARSSFDLKTHGAEVQRRILGPIWIGVGVQRADTIRPMLSARVEF